VYRVLLHLFPAAFRRQFIADMSADFDDGYTDATRKGPIAVASFILRSYLDLAISLPAQWLRVDSVVIAGLTTSVALAIWVGALYVAAREWPDGPATSRFVMQLGAALTAGCALSVLAQRLLRIDR
jgi:hypothetical protein